MDYGHLNDPRGVDFSLPPDDPVNGTVLPGSPAQGAQFRLGLPIWTEKSWVGRLYPPKTPAGGMLEAYGRQFNTIELNSTHYAMPGPEMMKRWREAVPAEFRFSPKMLQEISHRLDRPDLPAQLAAYYSGISELGDRLGPCFIQLPPQFGPERLQQLKRALSFTPPHLQIAVEFRHPEWFKNGHLIPEATEALRTFKAATVITDTAGRRDASHATLSAPWVIVRYLGAHGHPSTQERLESWSERLERWFAQGLEEIFFFVHQHQNVDAPELASSLVAKLKRRSIAPEVRDWKRWDVSDQMSLL